MTNPSPPPPQDAPAPRRGVRQLRRFVPDPLAAVYIWLDAQRHAARLAVAQAWERCRQRAWARLREIPRRIGRLLLPAAAADDTLFFFYDLCEHPVTYDIANQLVIAELIRRERGLRRLHLVVVPGLWRLQGADGYDAAVPPDAIMMRIHQLALPLVQLLPSCEGVTLCASREEAEWMRFALARHVVPAGYEPGLPERILPLARGRSPGNAAEGFFPMLAASPPTRAWAEAFLREKAGGRRPVVITLRQYGFMPGRNSRVADWIAFADGLDPQKYAAIFVPDTGHTPEAAVPGLQRHIVCPLASWNIGIRMALYEAAYANLAIMHGPMELALYNDRCRYAVFIPVGVSPQTEARLLSERGFSIGSDLPFARPWQRIIWEPDSLPAIRRAFAELESIIDGVGPTV